MDDLNAEPTGSLVIVPVEAALAKIEELESTAIIESLAGKVSKDWVYDFKQGGSAVIDLSIVGVEQASREMATKGEVLRIIDIHIEYEDEREARFFAIAARFAVGPDGRAIQLDTATGAKRQPKYMKLREGGERFNEHWYEIGVAKAERNAKKRLISDEVRQYIIGEAQRAGHTRSVAPPAPAPAPKAKAAAAAAAPAKPSNGDANGKDDIGYTRAQVRRALEERFGRHEDTRSEWEAANMPEGIGALTPERCDEVLAVLTQEAASAG